MKIVLISTDETEEGMGVKTLSSCLINQKFETAIILLNTPKDNFKEFHWEDFDEICQGAGLIGISCMTHGVKKAIEVKKHLSAKLEIPIIVGGIACISPESLLHSFDLVCHGEGEDLIVELAHRLKNNTPYDDIPGLWVKNGHHVIKNRSLELSRNLNEYPLPDYDYTHQFVMDGNRLVPMTPTFGVRLDDFLVLGSRGCPHCCSYCCNNALKNNFPWFKVVRHYSIDRLINNIKEVRRYYPDVRRLDIEDDTFFAKRLDEVIEFSKRYKKEINIPFRIFISPGTFDPNKLLPLVEAGMYKLIMGIQTGSENVARNIYCRNQSNEKIMQIAMMLNRYSSRIQVCYDFMGMNPFESTEDLINTIRFIKSLPTPFWIFNNNLAFYPGTDLYERAVRSGLDIHLRVKHSEASIGYSILGQEKIKHKLFHLLLLLMAGSVDNKRIGWLDRIFVSDWLIAGYRFLDEIFGGVTNLITSIVAGILNTIHLNKQNRLKIFLKKIMFS